MSERDAMPDFVPSLGRSLRAAAEEEVAEASATAHRGGRSRLSRQSLRVAVVAALVLCLAAVAAAAVTLWSPNLGDDVRGHPTRSATAPPAAELGMLSILRRPQVDRDRGPDAEQALRLLDPYTDGVRTDGIRSMGEGSVLIPVARYEHRDGRGAAIDDALCVFVPDGQGGGGLGCFSPEDVMNGRAVVAVGAASSSAPAGAAEENSSRGHFRRFAAHSGMATFVGLVPDGVSEVHVGHVDAPVEDNVFTLQAPATSGTQAAW